MVKQAHLLTTKQQQKNKNKAFLIKRQRCQKVVDNIQLQCQNHAGKKTLKKKNSLSIEVAEKLVLLGMDSHFVSDPVMDIILLLAKYYRYISSLQETVLCVGGCKYSEERWQKYKPLTVQEYNKTVIVKWGMATVIQY